MRILVIEDSDSIRHMIEALVATRGHQVVAVPSGVKGLEAALAQPPDVVLLDLHLPGSFDGFEVCERLRQNDATRAVPIIIISAMSDDESRRKALEKGATAFYTKPFSPTALLKELESQRARS
jgi:CheY-like chemotaxis protein